MFKRIFWLGMAAALGWMLWSLWRQRQDQLAATPPFLAPLEPRAQTMPVLETLEHQTPSVSAASQPQQPMQPAATPPPEPTPEPASLAPQPATSAETADTAAPLPEPATTVAAPEPAVSAALDTPAPEAQSGSADDELGDVIGYCPRCKTKRTIVGAHEEITESGRRAARGTCPVCNGRMFTFLPNK